MAIVIAKSVFSFKKNDDLLYAPVCAKSEKSSTGASCFRKEVNLHLAKYTHNCKT